MLILKRLQFNNDYNIHFLNISRIINNKYKESVIVQYNLI